MNKTYRVLIVEDDFRIANIHQQFIENIEGFSVSAAVKTGMEALNFLQEGKNIPDIILLDIYIPDVVGLDLLWEIRNTYKDMDIIIVSAANEVETIQGAIRSGVFDYIIKPVDISRFEQTLSRYKEQRQLFESMDLIEQADIDSYLLPKNSASTNNIRLPKGIDSITLNEITTLLKSKPSGGITAVELSKQIGTSRSTARRYLEYLVSLKKIETKLKYGSVGRPERKYVLHETYEQNE